MFKIGGRSPRKVVSAALHRRHYIALQWMFRIYDRPLEALARYLSGTGTYPWRVRLATPEGPVTTTLYSHHDLLTVNEIFCRQDYASSGPLSTVVDFGSNIGLSALYFLTRNPAVRVKLFEPLPSNIEKLRETLRGYEARYELFPIAVGTSDGEVEFGYEPTGRYGGIGVATASRMTVPCRSASSVIAEVLERPGVDRIDVLKVDIEGYEDKVIMALDPALLAKIDRIYAELPTEPAQLPGFACERYGSVVRWERARA